MSTHKGIDDLLAAGKQPQRLVGAAVKGFFEGVRARLVAQPINPEPGPVAIDRPHRQQAPSFPIEIFPERVARFARRVAAAMGCSVDFPGVALLVVSGAAIGAARSVQVKGGWHEKPGMYAVIVSPPGTAKTPALRAVMQPVYQEQDRLYQDHQAANARYKEDVMTYKEARKNHDREEHEPLPEPPTEPAPLRHLFVNDTTCEALAANLEGNRKGLLVFRDELTAWVRAMDMYRGRGTDRQFYLSAWSGEMVKVDRKAQKGQPLIIPHPFLSVLGGIQPDMLSELENEGGREDGFTHRILFSFPPEPKYQGWIDDEITEKDEQDWQVVVGRLLNLQPVKPEGASEHPRRLLFSTAGRKAFQGWCNSLAAQMNDADFPRELIGPAAKMKAYCARFALVLHLLRVACDEAGNARDEGEVDEEDVRRAILLCDYFLAHYRLVACRLQQTEADQQVEALLMWMQRKGLKSCSARDICRAGLCTIKTTKQAEKLLAEAIDREHGQWQDAGLGRKQNKRAPRFQLATSSDEPPTTS